MGVKALVNKVLTEVGFRQERFNLQWASAAEAPRFVKLITEFTNDIKKLGPLGDAEGFSQDQVQEKIEHALYLVNNQKLRVGFGNVTKSIRKEKNYTQDFIDGVVNEKMEKSISSGLIESGVLHVLKSSKSPITAKTVAQKTGSSGEDIDKILTALSKQGKVIQKSGNKWTLAAA